MIIRDATRKDASDMTELLNRIIMLGGSTAHQRPFDADRMYRHYIASPESISCQVADQSGVVIGFQSLTWPSPADGVMKSGWAIIATFVSNQATGKGVGKHLFAATKEAAGATDVATIDATIRADNDSGLRYYSRLGFIDYDRLKDIPLRDGTVVDRIRKRFDL